MLLSIGTVLGLRATSTIKTALESVTTADVRTWCETHLGVTIQAQRKLALGATKMG